MRYVAKSLTDLVTLANTIGGTLHINTEPTDEIVFDGEFEFRGLSILGPCTEPPDPNRAAIDGTAFTVGLPAGSTIRAIAREEATRAVYRNNVEQGKWWTPDRLAPLASTQLPPLDSAGTVSSAPE